MSKQEEGYNRRMSDTVKIPELNGTVQRLVDLAAAPLETPEQQEMALRELIKLNLHSYLITKQALGILQDALAMLINERKSIIDKVVDKFVVPFVYTIISAIILYVLKQP